MKLHELPSIKKRVQRIGRSGKRGSYSGRGVKGQKSRSGRRLYPAERDLIMRLPKHRGFRNKPKGEKLPILNIGELSRALKSFVQGQNLIEVNLELLKTAGLVGKHFKGEIKLLGNGDVVFPLKVVGFRVSESARAKIVKAGGTVENRAVVNT